MKVRRLLAAAIVALAAIPPAEPIVTWSDYDAAVLSDRPTVFYYRASSTHLLDAVNGFTAEFPKGHGWLSSPDGAPSPLFDGMTQYAVSSDREEFSVTHTGILTIEAWIAPSVLKFPHTRHGYVLWSGKGDGDDNHEWATRMYSSDNTDGRKSRISGYVFGPQGGYGAGSYYQSTVEVERWLHYVFIINTKVKSEKYPMGYTKLYIDGKYVAEDSIAKFPLTAKNGNAKLRIGTRDGTSHFKGGIHKFALYGHELSPESVSRHFQTSW